MSKQLRRKVAVLVLSLATMTSQVAPVFAATTTQSNSQSTVNVSAWAETVVKQFMGTSFKETYNYKFKSTREEFAEILEKALTNLGYEFSEPTVNPFKDTKSKSAIKLYNAGLIAGTGTNTFGAKDTLTREQLAVIICRVYDKLGVKMPNTVAYKITDEAKISSWAKESVKRAYVANIIKGDTSSYVPKAVVTREQAIVICSRTEELIKKAKEEQATNNNTSSNTGTNTNNQNTTVTNNLYTYDSTTKVITINKTCTIDASVTGTPKDFNKVTVASGVTATLKGITVKEATVNAKGNLVSVGSTFDELHLKDGTKFTGDKSTTVNKLYTYGSVKVDAEDSTIKTATTYEASSGDDVTLSGVLGTVNVDAPVDLTISAGEVNTLEIKNGDATVVLSADTDKISVEKDDVELDIDANRVDSLTLSGETDLTVAKNTKLKKLVIDEDAVDSDITLKSKYDIDISVSAKCKINNKTVKKTSKVTYEEGVLTIDGDTSNTVEDDEEDSISEAEEALTYSLILDSNSSKDSVITDLYLPTKLKGCSITWTSSNEAVISTEGKVTRIEKDSTVELKAKIKNGDSTSNKSFSITVKAKQSNNGGGGGSDNTTEDVDALLATALNKISVPNNTVDAFRIPSTVDGYNITVSTTSDKVTLSTTPTTSTGTLVTPVQSDSDVTVSLNLTATSGTTSKTRAVSFVIPKKVAETPNNESQIREALKSDLTAITVPGTIGSTTQVSRKSTNGYTVGLSATGNALSITTQDSVFVIKPNKTQSTQTANVTISVTDGTYTETKTMTVTIPAEDIVAETVTKELILADMEKILSTQLLPTALTEAVTVPVQHDSQYASVGKYNTEVSSNNKRVVVSGDMSNFTVTPDNVSLSEDTTATVTVTLSTLFQGESVTTSQAFSIVVSPKYSEYDFKAKVMQGLNARAQELYGLIPTTLTGISQPITYAHEYLVDGLDMRMVLIPQAYPNIEKSTIDDKIKIDYYKDGTFTITPLVSDGSTVDLPIKFSSQTGADTVSVVKNFTIQLPSAPISNVWDTAIIESEIFEIINSVDIQLVLTEDVGEVKVVVKDKHLQTQLGTATISSFKSVSSGVYTGTVEIKMSKNAILGEYTYEIYELAKDTTVVKSGDLTNGSITPYSSTIMTFVEN